jgi:hypothetical protein
MSHAIVRLATSAAEDFCVVDCTYEGELVGETREWKNSLLTTRHAGPAWA